MKITRISEEESYSIVEKSNIAQHYSDYAYNHPLYSSKMKIYSDTTVSEFFRVEVQYENAGYLFELGYYDSEDVVLKHEKVAIFRRKMSGFRMFPGFRELEERRNPVS